MPSTEQRIVSRIEESGRGTCFTPNALLDLGSPEAIRITLHRLVKNTFIRRLARGLYDFPKLHPVTGLLSPQPDEVARALAHRDASRIQPSGAYAANVLGLTEQVPVRIVFLTDGPAHRVTVGNREIILKNTTPRNMATAGRISGTIIQALRHIGAKQITDRHIARLRALLSGADKELLRTDRVYAPGWTHSLIDSIAEGCDN